MDLKRKILNKVADMLDDYRTPRYDTIECLNIKGKVKAIKTTYDCTYTEKLPKKEKNGIISIDKLLQEELGDNKADISFCEKDNVICIHNHSHSNCIETSYEFFEDVIENVYLICETKGDFYSVKGFIEQSSKYHSFFKMVEEIPERKAFEMLFFPKKEKKVYKETEEKTRQENLIRNYIEIDGKISSIGREFRKRDSQEAQFINIMQKYSYNGKVQETIMPVMLEGGVLHQYRNLLKIGDSVSINGRLSTYTDKDAQNKAVINCFELKMLNRENDNEITR